jgi:peptidoglycan-associated lipoprotein
MKQPPEVALSCTATDPEVAAGQNVQIIANAVVAPDPAELRYTWTAGAGTVRGQGSTVAIDTTNLAPGTYHVQGIAALVSNSSIDSSCEVSFRVNSAQAKTPDRTMPTKFAPPSESSFDDGARGHLKDAFFDYDKSDLRPDASSAMAQDAAYLVAHPAVSITLAGYSDERGSAEYNIALGLERAIAARDALASLGVPMSRMHVISYGKELSFCSDETENCYQLNRRAQLVLTDE